MIVREDACHVFSSQTPNPLTTDPIPVIFQVLVYPPRPQFSANPKVLILRISVDQFLQSAEKIIPIVSGTALHQGLDLPAEGLQHVECADELA